MGWRAHCYRSVSTQQMVEQNIPVVSCVALCASQRDCSSNSSWEAGPDRYGTSWVKTPAALVCVQVEQPAVNMDFLYTFMNHICPAMGAVIALLMFASPMKAVQRANRDKDLGVSAVGCLSAAPHTTYSRLKPQQHSNAVLITGTAADLEVRGPQAAAQTAAVPCSSPAYTHTPPHPMHASIFPC